MTVAELYKQAVKLISKADISDPEIEASVLLGHVLNKTKAELFLAGSETLSEEKSQIFNQYLSRRLNRIPSAYVLGEQEFWSLSFIVNPDVLIPRPETEQLIEIVLRTLKSQNKMPDRVLDLGTGSGVIAVVLAKELPAANLVAVDRSMAALRVARNNFVKHNLLSRIQPLCAYWGKAVKPGQWDLIVSNPPYVAHDAIRTLDLEVQSEPESALDGGENGMEEIIEIASQLNSLLKPKGWFFMEIGFDQKEFVLDLFNSMPYISDVVVHLDYAGLPRVLQARKLG